MKKIVLATLCFLMATGVFAQNKKSATPPQKSVTTEQDSTWIKIYRQASISSIKIKLSSDLEDNDVFKKVEEFYKNEVITDKTLEASRKGIVHIANALSMNSKINAIKDEILKMLVESSSIAGKELMSHFGTAERFIKYCDSPEISFNFYSCYGKIAELIAPEECKRLKEEAEFAKRQTQF